MKNIVLATAISAGCSGPSGDSNQTTATRDASFAGSTACADCHQAEYQAWVGSHHDWAMKPAEPATILGDFDDTSFTHFGVTTRFFKSDGQFFVNTEGPDGQNRNYEISYTFGVDPLQQYLIDTGSGRLQCLTIAWDTVGQRWFHLYPDERVLPDDPLHWTGVLQNWNGMCADCHSTNFIKGYDGESNRFQSTWSEVNVGCEACHGPGSEHIKAASAETYREEASGLAVNFSAGAPAFEVERCAPCHSRRHSVRVDNHYGEPLLDDYVPTSLRTGLYHAGGQILGEVYVYGSFAQSKMYGAGVRCSDCHNPHTLGLKADGDALCIGCHNPAGDTRFPTLPRKRYDTPEHHFHPAKKDGVSCVGCHMIERKYMVVDPRHDHSFRIPRPDLSATIGTPNACTDCHNDKPAQWAADAITSWYGTERPRHWGDVFAQTGSRSRRQQRALARVADDVATPVIVRATAIEHLEAYGPSDPIVRALTDRDPLIRRAAVAALDAFPVAQRGMLAAPRLHDSVRAVRLEAARVLSSVPPEGLDARDENVQHLLIREFEDLQRANGDVAASHLNLGVLYENKDRPGAAEREYRKALGINTYLQPARHNLANLYNRTGRNREAERVLREGIELAPDDGEFHYSLGLLLGEESRMEESAETLGRAADLLPYRARVRYNYALTLQHLDRRAAAEEQLRRAAAIDRDDPDIVRALAIFYVQDSAWKKALPWAQRLVALQPNAQDSQVMLQRIEAELER